MPKTKLMDRKLVGEKITALSDSTGTDEESRGEGEGKKGGNRRENNLADEWSLQYCNLGIINMQDGGKVAAKKDGARAEGSLSPSAVVSEVEQVSLQKRLSFTAATAAAAVAKAKASFSKKAALGRNKSSGEPSAVEVFLRLRPTLSASGAAAVTTGTQPTIGLLSDTEVRVNPPRDSQSFRTGDRESKLTYSRIFPEDTSQQQVFTSAVSPLIGNLMDGSHGLLFAYGITNAGKTYTIQGNSDNPGILPRAMESIFERLKTTPGGEEASVFVSYLEIYNNKIHDLLAPPPEKKNAWKGRPALQLKDERGGRVSVRGLRNVKVSSTKDALEQLHVGAQNRVVAQTQLNVDSSRSHSVFTITLQGIKLKSGRSGRLSIVDLAGSERGGRTRSSGLRMREAGKINASLMHLMHCIREIRWNQTHSKSLRRMVPFRDTKLTQCRSGQVRICGTQAHIELEIDRVAAMRFKIWCKWSPEAEERGRDIS
eukprot:g750.t1